MKKILVLNLGMKSIRSIIFDTDGEKIATSSTPLTTSLKEEQVTQEPEEWWKKGCEVIKNTLDKVPAKDIDYITVTASSACLVAVDNDLNCLTNCMMVSDRRAVKESDELSSLPSYKKIYDDTGLKMDAHMMLPKMLWVKNHLPEVYEKTRWFLSPNDFLIARLTGGVVVTDYINALKWHYDCDNESYPEGLIEEARLDLNKLPKVVSLGEIVGNVSKNIVEETGLSINTEVVVSTYDAICSFIGSGAIHDGEACDITGTVTVFRTVIANPPKVCVDGMQLQKYKEIGLNILGGSNNMGGGLIEWVKQCYYRNDKLPYEQMEKDATEADVGAGGLIFLPYLLGERAPIWDNDARGVFFGLERTHTRKEMTRAVFESTGFIDFDMIKSIERNGAKVDLIRLSGGLARVPLIAQIKADITGREIYVLDEFESTATGAAMIVCIGSGEHKNIEESVDVFSRVRMIIKPNMRNHKMYSEMYQLYKETYNTLRDLFPRRAEVVDKVIKDRKIKIENL